MKAILKDGFSRRSSATHSLTPGSPMAAHAEKRGKGRAPDPAAQPTPKSANGSQPSTTPTAAPQAATAVPPPAGPSTQEGPVTSTPRKSEVQVHIEVIHGGITNVKAPVAIGPRYQGLPP